MPEVTLPPLPSGPPPEALPVLLVDLLARQVEQRPEACAVEVPSTGDRGRCRLTYAELWREAGALARRLPALEGPDQTVCILLSRDTVRLYVAQVAALRAGAAYVGMDPAFPDDHLRRILADAEPVAVLTDPAGRERLARLGLEAGRLVDATAAGPVADPPPRPGWLTGESLAYLIYTSGTTGQPKGVMITHRSIVHLIETDRAAFGLGPGDRLGQLSSPAYDSSVEEIWMALSTGATLVPLDDDVVRMGPDLAPWLARERITVLTPPPTLLRALGVADPAAALPDLRLLYVGGEALPPDVADAWARGRRLVNGYGPTECTVTSLRGDVAPGSPITIGRPVPGVAAWVLDPDGQEVLPGELGELCLGGVALARGYRGAPELTAARFPRHPRLGRIYRTGDLAREEADGTFTYHGRIDAQVKLRGYRIELEAVEACLASLPEVREAACRVQGPPGREELAAHVVPHNPDRPPTPERLREALAERLPTAMVPTRYGTLAELPKSVSGKLRRDALPELIGAPPRNGGRTEPRTPAEAVVAEEVRGVLGLAVPPDLDADFFMALGGNSLLAAQLITRLREHPTHAALTVRDVYETRTPAALAARATPPPAGPTVEPEWGAVEPERGAMELDRPQAGDGPARVQGLLQGLFLAAEMVWVAALALSGVRASPELLGGVGLVAAVLGWPLLAGLLAPLYGLLALGAACAAKWVLIGRYRAGRWPVFGGFGTRQWLVRTLVRLVPWNQWEGTEAACFALRCLGARIGRGVHFHRGTLPLEGGWDLLEIGDEATLAQEASLRLASLHAGDWVFDPIRLASGAVVDVRASVAGGATVEEDGHLAPLSSLTAGTVLPAGEHWSGVPATAQGAVPPISARPSGATQSAWGYAASAWLARAGVAWMLALPFNLLLLAGAAFGGLDAADLAEGLVAGDPARSLAGVALLASLGALGEVLVAALVCRGLGRVEPGDVPLRSLAYLRIWLKAQMVNGANRRLSGTLFWPAWLRAAGMRVGADCEVSTILDVIPELVTIGPESFFADGIYLGPPPIRRGVASPAPTRLGRHTFLGNHAVIPAGSDLPDDLLIGVCTVPPADVRSGSAWFGLPAFELPQREVVDCDRSLTHAPTPARYWNRVGWEALRFAVPAVPAVLAVAWLHVLAEIPAEAPALDLARAAGVTLLAAAMPVVLVVLLKWLLLGRVRPGTHPLWSCWCSRWDFLYVAWGEWARPVLAPLEGTLWLHVFLRLVGVRIGRRVVLSPGFSQVVDPDMLHFADGATVSAMFQAHTFEDRVLKVGPVYVGPGATLGPGTVPLYGAEIGEGAEVAANSVVMKHERLLAHTRYEGVPSRPGGLSRRAAGAGAPRSR